MNGLALKKGKEVLLKGRNIRLHFGQKRVRLQPIASNGLKVIISSMPVSFIGGFLYLPVPVYEASQQGLIRA